MAVTTVDNRSVVADADTLTNWSTGSLETSPRCEGTNSVGVAYDITTGTIYYTPGTALNLDGDLLYIRSYCNAIQNGWKEATLANSSHMLYMDDGTNQLALCQAGNDRDVFKHAKSEVGFQSFLIDLDYLSTKNTNGEVLAIAGSVASFVKTSVDDVGSRFVTLSKALGGGKNCWVDIIRVDDGGSNSGITIYGGGSGTEGNFSEIVSDDESISADKGFGVIREYSSGIYGCQGILKFGTTTATGNAYFLDSDFALIFENRDVNNDKFKIFVYGNSTDTNDFRLSNGTIQSAGPGVELDLSSTQIDVIDIDGINFLDLLQAVTFPTDTVTNSLTHAAENSLFRNCGTVTVGTVDFDNNSITSSNATTNAVIFGYDVTALNTIVSGYEGTADTSALVWNPNADPDGNIDGSSFTKGTAATHAIEFGISTPTTMTLRNIAFSGYNASDSQNDSTLLIKRTTGTVTINLIGCTGNISYKSAGADVNLIISPVSVSIHTDDNNGDFQSGVQVWLAAEDATGELPYLQAITSITRATTTATVTFTAAHGLKTNDYLSLAGITDKTEDNYGAFQVTVTSTTVCTYQTTDSGSTNYTGTITGTGGLLYGTTDVNGDISISRSFSGTQPVEGYGAKSTTSPRFKRLDFAGNEVSASGGLSIIRRLILDE